MPLLKEYFPKDKSPPWFFILARWKIIILKLLHMNLKINIPLITSLLLIILFITGCQKKKPGLEDSTFYKIINRPPAYRLPQTEEEKTLVENLAKIAEVLKELYKQKSNLAEVNAAIFSRTYTDGSILLKDLVYPESQPLGFNKKFRTMMTGWNYTFGDFSKNFWKEVNKRDDLSLMLFLGSMKRKPIANGPTARILESPSMAEQVSIYFPYMENFNGALQARSYTPPLTTIVAAAADADAGNGYEPYYDISGKMEYKNVSINDELAMLTPTHIIGINGVNLVTAGAFLPGGPGTAGKPLNLPGLTREIKQVYIGDVRCRKQYDALISFTGNGGGSEIRFVRGDGFLKEQDGQVKTADVFVMGDFSTLSRSEIKNEVWTSYSLGWDEDWESSNKEQFFGIFEEDNRNSGSINFGLETTVKQIQDISLGGSVKGTLDFKSDDHIIRQTNYKYDSFFSLNRINLEGEMRNGWPVRDRQASVSFTLFDRSLY
jgi:hypothetical protein